MLYENEFDIQQSMPDSAFEAIDFFVYLKKYHFVVWGQQLWNPIRRIGMALVYLTNTLWKSSITLDIKDSLVPDNVWYQRIFMSSVMLDFRDSETWTTMLSKAYNVVVGPTIYETHRILYNRSLPCCDFFSECATEWKFGHCIICHIWRFR